MAERSIDEPQVAARSPFHRGLEVTVHDAHTALTQLALDCVMPDATRTWRTFVSLCSHAHTWNRNRKMSRSVLQLRHALELKRRPARAILGTTDIKAL